MSELDQLLERFQQAQVQLGSLSSQCLVQTKGGWQKCLDIEYGRELRKKFGSTFTIAQIFSWFKEQKRKKRQIQFENFVILCLGLIGAAFVSGEMPFFSDDLIRIIKLKSSAAREEFDAIAVSDYLIHAYRYKRKKK